MGSLTAAGDGALFAEAAWYDRSINWSARLERELPFLRRVLGPPGDGGVLDAGCGPGRHAIALTKLGYHLTGADLDEAMLGSAARNAEQEGVKIEFLHASYAQLATRSHGGYDGVICLANALAAAGDRERCRDAIRQFSAVLRPGGRLIVQVLNFRPMRDEHPCVRGPRVTLHDGVEYVSVRHFTFGEAGCIVTNITSWKGDSRWQCHARRGVLYPVAPSEVHEWCSAAGLRVDGEFGSYEEQPFEINRPGDFIFTATRRDG